MKHCNRQSGFTIVELIVTIVVAGMFIAIISQMNSFVVKVATSSNRFALASNLAYSNLRIYANGQPASAFGFVCNGDDTSDTESVTPYNDGFKHSDAAGTPLIDTNSTTAIYNLPPPVIQKVTAVAPYGCGNTVKAMPVRIVSTVTYGNPARKVVHATYVNGN